jgi:integrase/recombinase XerD
VSGRHTEGWQKRLGPGGLCEINRTSLWRILSVLSVPGEPKRNRTKHEHSWLTAISDAGSTPAASTIIYQYFTDSEKQSYNKRTIEQPKPIVGRGISPQRAHAMLSVYTRHYPPCPQKNPAYRRCKCPKWIQGTSDKEGFIRRSAKTRSWEKAQNLVKKLEDPEATPAVVPLEVAQSKPIQPEPDPKRAKIVNAVETFLDDAKSRGLKVSTLQKLTNLCRRQLLGWAESESLVYLDELATANLTVFRSTWSDGPLSRKKKHERLIGFFEFCIGCDWIQKNPAKAMKSGKVNTVPTDYFPREEFDRIIDSTYIYQEKGYVEYRNHATRLRILTLLMRWSGLRISDAVTLDRSRLVDNKLLLYQAKTGTPVFVPLPEDVAESLRTIPPGPKPNPRYFFWTGNGDPSSATKDWQRSFRRLFEIANITKLDGTRKRCFPQMFRDTFAIELLLAGVPIDQVSILLGHSSVKITEKHYSPWVKARQTQLEESVKKSWEILCQVIPRKSKSR